MTDERRLAVRFAEVSGDLLSESSEELTFQAVVDRAVEMVPGCVRAAITLRRRHGRVETVAASDDLMRRMEAMQYDVGEGPCLDAAFERVNVVVQDVASEDRWPAWSERARALGIASMMAIRLHTGEQTLGALNLVASRAHNFEGEAEDVALIFAAHATEAMAKARMVTGLRAALESRHTIGIAQGVLAARYGISYEHAFDVLHRYSNQQNRKLRDVAEEVATVRALPEDPAAETTGR